VRCQSIQLGVYACADNAVDGMARPFGGKAVEDAAKDM